MIRHPRIVEMIEDPFTAFAETPAPETQNLLTLVDQMMDAMPPEEEMTVQDHRDRAENNPLRPPKLDHGRDLTVPGPRGDIEVRILVPPEVRGVYLYIHGGGWISGRHDMSDPELWQRALDASVVVYSVGYRLAPEHPYPAPNDDCEAAALWLIENAAREFGTDSIVIGGESAGANLAASTLLRLRDKHGFTGIKGAELRYGMYDLRLTPGVRSYTGRVLHSRSLGWILDHCFPDEVREDPDASPLLAALHDMPPALFIAGTADSLVEDSMFMWARWRAAGNPATLKLYAGGPHAFDHVPGVPIADEAKREIVAFIDECIEDQVETSVGAAKGGS